jgi:N-acetylglucosaminyldiphosphoundecaprenol N-acetyl-beta-D-mannosaminyltransferase
VLGVGIHAVDMWSAVQAISAAVEGGRKGYVCVTGVHGVIEAQQDPRLRRILNSAFLNLPDGLKARLTERFPGLRIVGTYTPPFRPLEPGEISALYERVARVRPDITWVGLSTPKQERFMAEHWKRLETTLMIGVGAAFDYHTGRIKDAPDWVKESGLQWVHRLAQEPGRLWKRYAVSNSRFLLSLPLQAMRIRRFPLDAEPTTPPGSFPDPESRTPR